VELKLLLLAGFSLFMEGRHERWSPPGHEIPFGLLVYLWLSDILFLAMRFRNRFPYHCLRPITLIFLLTDHLPSTTSSIDPNHQGEREQILFI